MRPDSMYIRASGKRACLGVESMLGRLVGQLVTALGGGATRAARSQGLVAQALEAQRRGEMAEAEATFRAAVSLDGNNVSARHLLGALLSQAGKAAEACEVLGEVVEREPRLVEARFSLALALQAAGNTPAAETRYREVLQLAPDFAPARSNLAGLLFAAGEFDAAISDYRAALEANSAPPELWYNLGNAYIEQQRTAEAVAAYDQALTREPDYADAHFNRALALLRAGQWASGWPGYEWRFRTKKNPPVWRGLDCPLWEGESLEGKTLVVWGEQGLGDEIMFASCLPRLLRVAGRVMLECDPRLRALFRASFATAEVHGAGERAQWIGASAADGEVFHVPIGSLPQRLAASASPPFEAGGYFTADGSRVAYWRGRLGQLGAGLKVGISWRGGLAHSRTAQRSIELERWLPVLRVPGVRFVSLQYTREYEALAAFERANGVAIRAWPEAIEDLGETAALIAALDVVISVCNTTVHLGGALGRPVWVLAPHSAEWRYGLSGETMSWYPSVTVLRQSDRGHWEPVIEEAAARLAELMRPNQR